VRLAPAATFVAVCVSTAWPAAAAETAGVHLSWVRDDASAECPDAAGIEAEVARRLGEDPFRRAPAQFIEAMVTRQADTYAVSIAMRGPDGKLIGNRSLTSQSADCGSIATAAALTIAILIDPDAMLRSAAAPPPRLETAHAPAPVPPEATPAGSRGRVGAFAAGGWGVLPGLAPGVGLAATIDVAERLAVGAVVASFPERRASGANDGFAFGVSYLELLGCFVAAGAGGLDRVRWELCVGVAAGALHVAVDAPNPIDPGQRWHLAATQLTRVIIPVLRDGFVELGLEAAEPYPRRAFFVEGRPAGMDTVFTQSPLALTGFAGAGLRWR
jgi:hypothetical protein